MNKLIALLAIVMMTLSLVACDGGNASKIEDKPEVGHRVDTEVDAAYR